MTITLPRPWRPLAVLAIVLTACTSTTESPAPSPTTTLVPPARTRATPTPTDPKQEVLAAYERSWQVFAEALRHLDATQLPTAFAGSALETVRGQVLEHRASNQPVHVDITHRPRVVVLDGNRAVVQDNYTNRSVPLDPATMQPTHAVQPEVVRQHRSLTRIDGTWKVTFIVEEKVATP